MDWSLLAGFAAMAAVIEISPGPNFLLITRSVPKLGMRGALANCAGFVGSYLLHGSLAIYGISAILAAEPVLLVIIQLAGACYLMYLGIQSLLSQGLKIHSLQWIGQFVDMHLAGARGPLAVEGNSALAGNTVSIATGNSRSNTTIDIFLDAENLSENNGELFRCFREGLLTSALNPKITLFYIAAIPQFNLASTDTVMSSFVLVFVHATICALWVVVVALALGIAVRKSNSQCFASKLDSVSGVALMGLSIAFFVNASRLI